MKMHRNMSLSPKWLFPLLMFAPAALLPAGPVVYAAGHPNGIVQDAIRRCGGR